MDIFYFLCKVLYFRRLRHFSCQLLQVIFEEISQSVEQIFETEIVLSLLTRAATTVHPIAALDKLLPHKDALETYLKNKLGNLFGLEFDILLYGVTSTSLRSLLFRG